MQERASHLLATTLALTTLVGPVPTVYAANVRLAELTGETNRLEEIPAANPPAGATQQRSNFDLMNELEKLRQEVRQLRGELEEQAHELEQAQKRQQKTLSDFEKRLHTVESGNASKESAPAADVAAGTGGGEPKAPTGPETSGAASTAEKPTRAAAAPAATTAPAPTKTAGTAERSTEAPARAPGTEQEAYDQAFNLLKLGRYDESITSFKAFLSDYPGSKYTDSALYWLGETYYVKNQYEQAIAEYSRLVKEFPNSQRLTQALLKIGYSYHELGQTDKAVETLQGLRQRHPSSTAARLAEERLRRIRLEQQ